MFLQRRPPEGGDRGSRLRFVDPGRVVRVGRLPMTVGMWAVWVGAGLLGWLVVAALLGVVVGSGVRHADRRDAALAPRNFVVDPGALTAGPR